MLWGEKCTYIELGCSMMCILHLERFPAAVFYYLARRAHCDRTYRQYSSERPPPGHRVPLHFIKKKQYYYKLIFYKYSIKEVVQDNIL